MKRFPYLLLLSAIALVGCVGTSVETEELHSPPLMISQNSDGITTMVWESDSDYDYTIFFRDGDRPWVELRSVTRVRGTGGTMQATDRVNPNRKIMRRYRLHFEKAGTLR